MIKRENVMNIVIVINFNNDNNNNWSDNKQTDQLNRLNNTLLYHGAWEITIVTFDVPRELYAHNLLPDREILTQL